MKLERLKKERELELELERQRAEEAKAAAVKAQEEYEEDLRVMNERRATMDAEELARDCLAQFETADLIFTAATQDDQFTKSIMFSASMALGGVEEGNEDEVEANEEPPAPPEVKEPDGAFEWWLANTLGTPGEKRAEGSGDTAAALFDEPRPSSTSWWKSCPWSSFGELPPARVGSDMAVDLAASLVQGATAFDEQVEAMMGEAKRAELVSFDEQFDDMIRRFERDALGGKPDNDSVEQDDEPLDDAEAVAAAKQAALEAADKLRARAARHRDVANRVQALAPCLEQDFASTRLVASLAVLDLAVSDGPAVGSRDKCDSGRSQPGPDLDFRSFRAPLNSLSVADACWALCSEKRHLVVERLLPSVAADGRWFWPQIRRTGLVWWLHGGGTQGATPAPELEQLDKLVTKLAQSASAQIRHFEKTGNLLGAPPAASASTVDKSDAAINKTMRRLADEAVFWYVLMGFKVEKLRALMKTGALWSEPALNSLLQHERATDAEFMSKNAFRLIQLHRFHLAAALFMLCEAYEEAGRVVVSRLKDCQLLLLLARRKPEVSAPLLADLVTGIEDVWVRLLVAWHSGDSKMAAQCARDPKSQMAAKPEALEVEWPDAEDPIEEDLTLFDGTLRQVGHNIAGLAGLVEVARTLFGPGIFSDAS